MQVAVIGGTGVVGRCVVAELVARGHTALAVSRTAPADGPAAAPGGRAEREGAERARAERARAEQEGAQHAAPSGRAEHRRADLRSGDGLAAALDGADAVVDASNDQRARKDELARASRTLLAAEAVAGVGHHVAISIVGCDRAAVGYYGAKVAQEQVVTSGPVAWSLLRATQFHQLIAWAFSAAGRARLRPTGRALIQPIDPAVVATRLVGAVEAGPGGRLPDVGGPRVQTLAELAADWQAHGGAAALPLPLPLRLIGRTGRALRDGSLTAPGAAAPGPTFAQWLDLDRDRAPAAVRESAAR